jgi:putative membrane protein
MTLQPGCVDRVKIHSGNPAREASAAETRMPDLPPGFVEAEHDMRGGRIEGGWNPDPIAITPPGVGSVLVLTCGVALLVIGWVVIAAIGFVIDQFDRSAVFGMTSLLLFGAAFGLIAYAVWVESKAYRLLQHVDVLRAQLRRDDIAAAELRRSSQLWLRALAGRLFDPAEVQSALDQAQDADAIRQIIRDRVLPELRQAARQTGLRAAVQGGALVAISPSAALDGVFVGLRGLAVIREVAQIYGLRPGPVVTVALLRRVVLTAAAVTGTELLSRTLADAMLEKTPVLKHLAGALPGTSLATIRLYRLACVTAEACSPVPETATP